MPSFTWTTPQPHPCELLVSDGSISFQTPRYTGPQANQVFFAVDRPLGCSGARVLSAGSSSWQTIQNLLKPTQLGHLDNENGRQRSLACAHLRHSLSTELHGSSAMHGDCSLQPCRRREFEALDSFCPCRQPTRHAAGLLILQGRNSRGLPLPFFSLTFIEAVLSGSFFFKAQGFLTINSLAIAPTVCCFTFTSTETHCSNTSSTNQPPTKHQLNQTKPLQWNPWIWVLRPLWR